MRKEDIEAMLNAALQELEARDAYLLDMSVNERSVTHRLAGYLEAALPPESLWSVDCEFNRDGDVPKRIEALIHDFADGASSSELLEDSRARTVFPDIIVHVRGTKGPNLLVIEAKRHGAPPAEIERDRKKLRAYILEYGYSHAYLILLRVERSTIERVEVPARNGQAE